MDDQRNGQCVLWREKNVRPLNDGPRADVGPKFGRSNVTNVGTVTVCIFDKVICRGQGIQPIQDAVPDLRIFPQLNADDRLGQRRRSTRRREPAAVRHEPISYRQNAKASHSRAILRKSTHSKSLARLQGVTLSHKHLGGTS
jgi:hypothetical protein